MKPSLRGCAVFLGLAGLVLVMHAKADVTLISKPITGAVIDASTGKPVPDAVVTAKWIGSYSTVAHGGMRCAKGLATVTDASGRFTFPEWTMKHPDLDGLLVEVTAFRNGWTDTARGKAGA